MIGGRLRGITGQQASPPQVWAVGNQTAQVTWGWLPEGLVTVRCGDHVSTVEQPAGPGSVYITELEQDRRYDVQLADGDGRSLLQNPLQLRTPRRPGGDLVTRVATVSDMHLGASRWGFFKGMQEVSDVAGLTSSASEHAPPIVEGLPPGPYRHAHPIRCAHSALSDATTWGAELLVIKGDSAQHETKACFDLFGGVVDAFPELPMLAIPGNHDVDNEGKTIPATVGNRELPICRHVDYTDLPGVRVVVADTSIPGRGKGTVEHVESAILEAVSESDNPVLLLAHHQFQPGKIARHWPIGIAAPASTNFLDQLDNLTQPVVVSSGHSHRNRTRRHKSVLLTEVGSAKDWPCVWAGYNIYEGGLEQMVFRVSEQSAMAWSEYSQLAVGGLWSKWSPGKLDDRCVNHLWPLSKSYSAPAADGNADQRLARHDSNNTG